MAPPDDDNVGGGQGGAAGNAGGVVDRLKSLEMGGLSSFDPKGDPTTLCANIPFERHMFRQLEQQVDEMP